MGVRIICGQDPRSFLLQDMATGTVLAPGPLQITSIDIQIRPGEPIRAVAVLLIDEVAIDQAALSVIRGAPDADPGADPAPSQAIERAAEPAAGPAGKAAVPADHQPVAY